MSKVDITDNARTSKDSEILRLLNQIVSDMVKRSDVDEMIAAAVKEAVDKVNAENERKMKAMAAEYEAVIASLKKEGQRWQEGRKMTCMILAFAYSLTQSCKLCNVNPYDYWEDLLTNSCNPTRTIDCFRPHLWRK